MNTFNIFGKIIEEPEKIVTSNGTKMCKLKVSVSKNNTDQEITHDILDVALFRKLAEEEYDVGQYVAINGKLTSNSYKNENNTYNFINLIANNIEVISGL